MKYSKEEKTKRMEDWKQSGQSAWAYAKEKGLSQQTFANWVKAERESKGGFVELKSRAAQQYHARGIILEKGEIRIHVPFGTSGSELSSIIGSLQAAI